MMKKLEELLLRLLLIILLLVVFSGLSGVLVILGMIGMDAYQATGDPSPKFRCNQTVHISQGFYAGNTGIATEFNRYPPRYYVKVSAGTCKGELLMIAEEDLEEVQEAEK